MRNKMKFLSITKVTAAVAALFAVASCSSENEPANEKQSEKVALEVSVAGIVNPTRSIIDGEMLPNGSEFSLRAYVGDSGVILDGAMNERVFMNGGVAQLANPIYIPTEGPGEVGVRAIYPYQHNMKDEENIEILAFEGVNDYLWGQGDGYANILNPKVPIVFNHVLARITLRFTTTDDNETSYDFSNACLKPGKEFPDNCYDYAVLNVLSGELFEKQWKDEGSPALLSADFLSRYSDPLIMDFLVIPTNTDFYVNISSSMLVDGVLLPTCDYVAGVQYVYNIQVSDGKKLVITDCQIKPWENTDMPDDIKIIE